MGKIRVLLVDDHAVLRAGLRLMLSAQPDMEVVGEASDGREAIEAAGRLSPEVILLDIGMPGMNGIDATQSLRHLLPEVRILILTMHDDEGYLRQVLRAGASGYVLKKAADTELLSAIRAVHRGEVYVYPSLTRVLVEELFDRRTRGADGDGRNDHDGLSEREREVLRLVALGHSNQEIADILILSVKTVETHKARIMDKLGLRGRAELVRYAIRKGLMPKEP